MLHNARGKSLMQLPISSPVVLHWIIDNHSLKICLLRDFVISLNFLSTAPCILCFWTEHTSNSTEKFMCQVIFASLISNLISRQPRTWVLSSVSRILEYLTLLNKQLMFEWMRLNCSLNFTADMAAQQKMLIIMSVIIVMLQMC